MFERNVVLQWFLSLKKPTQAQFHGFINSVRWLGVKIPVADIEGIEAYLGNSIPPVVITLLADGTYAVPVGYAVYKIYITPQVDITLTVEGDGNTYLDGEEYIAARTGAVDLSLVADNASKELAFSGITGSTKVQIHLHKI